MKSVTCNKHVSPNFIAGNGGEGHHVLRDADPRQGKTGDICYHRHLNDGTGGLTMEVVFLFFIQGTVF